MLVDRNFCMIIIAQLGLVTTRDELILLKEVSVLKLELLDLF
ncbi:hypothetical protein LEP1GSC062_3079 [Leptospira alexanderi serovar Manhao 3 str. L 60]|uniref:Uncharacterized protein n=1 Tax=Leptospira alexanderi serovar Manhao 3 str. L 60 TaxID=1049759 RepID=V6I828_9LEPT|nr:hypothetical protein LEP1GSC062_3079 [Leptospira alexanderi serovar Manhao 3 str. L 60]